ncbi:MAG: sensor histidine kinase [Tunicatimonas sp.]|uniref:tetratricopeptide repeat-containing sensor histidine kinase n=1 Tax=Tunicatimonas sp. TaxID=1940096 RepID=UPI003C767A18
MKKSILLVGSIFICVSLGLAFPPDKGFDALLSGVDKLNSGDKNRFIAILEELHSLQNIRYKDSVGIVLSKIEPKIQGTKNSRIEFLYDLILSRNHLFEHNYSEGISSATKAAKNNQKSKRKEMVYLYTTLGSLNYFKADYVNSLEWHLKALSICENELDNSCLPGIYNNIAVVYFGTNDVQKIEEFTRKAYDIADSTENLMEKSRAAGNMAIVFAEQGKFAESEKWFLEDLEIDLELNDSLSVARNYNNLGKLFEYKQDFPRSLQYYQKGLEVAKAVDDKASIALGYQNVGWLEHKNGNNQEAERLFAIGMQQTDSLGNLDKLRDAYLNISEFYEATERPNKAFEFFIKYHNLNDSLVGENHLAALSELEVKYDTQKKENELLLLSQQKQANEALIISQGRTVRQLSLGLGIILILSILGFFLYKQWSQNKKQAELILAISETQNEERKRIAQDLHDSIGGSLALTKSKFKAVENSLPAPSEELRLALQTLQQTSDQVRRISHDLMPGELVRFGLVAAIQTLLENLNEEEINAQFNSIQLEQRLEPVKEIQLYRIIQEALQNVLRHAKAKNLFIQLNKHKNYLSLMIEDDGRGMGDTASKGIGLKNIEQRVRLLKGIFTIDSAPEKGTLLNIQIPV